MSTIMRCTVCFLVDETGGKVCLGLKKRGFGVGKWNGAGGKIHKGETCEDCVLRELEEEFGVQLRREYLEYRGLLQFFFPEDLKDIEGNVYVVKSWDTEPIETEEMRPAWFSFDELPFHSMWEDDRYWLLPVIKEGKSLKTAQFTFDENELFQHVEKLEFEP